MKILKVSIHYLPTGFHYSNSLCKRHYLEVMKDYIAQPHKWRIKTEDGQDNSDRCRMCNNINSENRGWIREGV